MTHRPRFKPNPTCDFVVACDHLRIIIVLGMTPMDVAEKIGNPTNIEQAMKEAGL